ncbi:MAG: AraC family transcriptional regulator [Cyclobacteriaceae bacterium]
MIDFYSFIEDNPTFKQFKVDELLFMAYDCPIEVSPLDYFVEKNYFCYVFKGGAKWRTQTDEYTLKVGDAAFLKKGAHKVYKILNGDFCALIIFIPDQFISSVVKSELSSIPTSQKSITTDSIIPLEVDPTLSDYFSTVLNYFSQTNAPSKSLLNIKFKELIINIVTSNRNQSLTEYFREIAYSNKESLEVIMEENFSYNLKLKDFAKLSGRSLASFNRDFAKTYGTTPGRWLKLKRLEYSRLLLETTSLNINQITLESGFENTSHFIRTFKSHFNHSPLRFKKIKEGSL